MIKSLLSTAIISLLALAGCTVGPDYRQPVLKMPRHWSSALAGGETNRPAALAHWWRKFGDTNLDLLITQAVQSNLDLRIAEDRVREARAESAVVAGGLWPSVGTLASYSRNRWSKNSFPPVPAGVSLDYSLFNAGFDSAWELDLFGGTRRAIQAAQAEVGAAEYGRRAVLVSLVAEVARNYLEARGYEERLEITRKNIRAQRQIVALTRNRYHSGLSSDLDVQQATALLGETEAQVPSLQTGHRQSVYHLAVLLGQPPGALLADMAGKQPIPPTPPVVPVGLPSDLLLRRPDVQRAERQLAAATARIGVAVSDLFPKFSLTGNVGLESMSVSDWFDAGSRFWSAGPTVQWRLFEAGRIRANIHLQNARQRETLAAYEKTVLTALEDVENALTAYANDQVRERSLSRSAQADQQALELSRQLYRNGLAGFLRVLESERSLYKAQDALVLNKQALSLDLVRLYKAMGGGWQTALATGSESGRLQMSSRSRKRTLEHRT